MPTKFRGACSASCWALLRAIAEDENPNELDAWVAEHTW